MEKCLVPVVACADCGDVGFARLPDSMGCIGVILSECGSAYQS